MLRTVAVGVGTVLVAACSSSAQPATPSQVASDATAPSAASSGGPGRLVDIGQGRTMYLECSGTGSPTVVLVSGLGERADNWQITSRQEDADRAVYQQSARVSRVCAYDRPGTETTTASGRAGSRSTPVPQPTSGTAAANDLAAMLVASGEPGPYVLVGHSYGGIVIRLYAAAHPRSVAGLVFDDALSEYLPTRLTSEQAADLEKLNSPAVQGRPADAESVAFGVIFPQVRAISSMPTVPTVVLSADRKVISAEDIASGKLPPFVTQSFADALWSAQLEAQDALAAKFPGARHVTATHAGHYIHVEQPKLVDDAIADVVSQVRAQPQPSG
jgi:pimeloyl-ACP methyl ester carboxylesterase